MFPPPNYTSKCTFALEALFEEAKEQDSTVVAEHASCPVRVHCQNVRADDFIVLLLGMSWKKGILREDKGDSFGLGA